jgi:uncharacterized membrane protein
MVVRVLHSAVAVAVVLVLLGQTQVVQLVAQVAQV